MQLLLWIAIPAMLALGVFCAGHALIHKRQPRGAMGWIGVCLAVPLLGPFLYFLFGINRIRTRARALRSGHDEHSSGRPSKNHPLAIPSRSMARELRELARISETVTGDPLLGGNRIEPLYNGEEAYPAMLAAIRQARELVYLSTYIFDTDHTGIDFVDALADAVGRGVDVRVLVDGFGELYSTSLVSRHLKRKGVSVARFLPPRLFPMMLHVNLRNHRKILVVDHALGFTGGMNLGDRHLAENLANPERVVDVHFRLRGPLVAWIEAVFLKDWAFATGDDTPPPPIPAQPAGDAVCRLVVDGPDKDLDKLANILVGAVSAARRRIDVVTPYFVPPRSLIGALQAAALRGVEVQIVLPGRNNLPFVHYATRNMLWEMLRYGIRVYYQPPPFVHTKLFLVDGHYAQIGSANVDTRSLRLNFELTVEVFDRAFCRRLEDHVESIRRPARELDLAELEARPLQVRIRDALCWVLSPYL